MMKRLIPSQIQPNTALVTGAAVLALAFALCAAIPLPSQERPSRGRTVVGIRDSMFTINGSLTYTPAAGFPDAHTNLIGTLLNVRAVQAIFDDENYPKQGSRNNPYATFVMGPVSWDYPDGNWDPERNVREFIEALPEWRKAGLLAFTVNLQGGGPTDGNYGPVEGRGDLNQPHYNSGFDPEGNLKPACARRVERIIGAADRLGMVVIVGLFYFGQDARVTVSPDGKYIREAVKNGMEFLKGLPYRNVLVEINNEISPGYRHPQLRPDGISQLIALAQQVGGGEIPVSISWVGDLPQPGSNGYQALLMANYILIHTNGRLPEEVHTAIQQWRRLGGYDRPMLINEDGFSSFNLHAAVQEHVGWGYYDQGWSNYRDGFQSPPTNWRISTPLKWLFFEQVARLTGSPTPPMPEYDSSETPVINLIGISPNQVIKGSVWVEAIIEDRHSRWPIQRVEFFIDGKPYVYREHAPYMLGGERWDSSLVSPGRHILRVVAVDRRGPRFTQTCFILEVPFVVER